MAWSRRKSTINLALVCVSTLSTLLGFELFLRWAGPESLQMQRNDNTYRSFSWDEAHTQFDEAIGFITKPHLDVTFENLEYETNVRTNSWGLRDDEASLIHPDIILLGDSFLFGWGVQEDEMAASIVEEITGNKVLNMGVAC